MKNFSLKSLSLTISLICTAGYASTMTPGTYTGTATGRNGDVSVEVKVNNNKIEAIQVTKHSETPGIGDLAVEALPKAIMDAQKINVDNVSGASVTSRALKSAASKALVKAGAPEEMLKGKVAPKDDKKVEYKKQADVIIVGGGGAGMVAAATAVGRGAHVIVLEKMAMLGGNTARSEGNMSAMDPDPTNLQPMTQAMRDILAKYTDTQPCSREAAELQKIVKKQLAEHDAAGKKYLFDSPEFFALQTIMGGDCKNDPELVKTMTANATEAMKWLDDQSDMTWFHVPRSWLDGGIGGLYPRGQWPRKADGQTPISTYDAYIKPLAQKVRNAGSHIYISVKVTDLIKDKEGRIVGVRALDKDGKELTFTGKNVILASGGYGANLAMVKKYNDISVIATSNQPGTTGEVIEEAVKAGAALEGMKYIQIHPHGNPKNGELESAIAGRPLDTPYVNKNGFRFVDETGRRDEISHGILKQPDQVVYAVYDEKTLEQKKVRRDLLDIALQHGYAIKANTLDELAEKAGINKENFLKTIEQYNKATVAQDTKDLPVPKIVTGNTVDKAPFFAVPLTTTIHHTMGGIKINEKTQVLDRNGNVIPGLYAAGEVTGGIHGSNRLGRNALTDLLVFGHIAGKEVTK